MYAIINLGNGKYYTSAVFGMYNDVIKEFGSWKQYAVVLDEKKEKLICFSEYDQSKKPYLYKMILVTDGDQSDWDLDEHGYGGVSFLNKEEVLDYVRNGTPAEILKKCLEYDTQNTFSEIQTVRTEKDIDNFMWCSGCLHDAYIESIEQIDEGIKIMFDGVWGCKIEVIFAGDVSYDADSRNPETEDPYWFGSTVAIKDEYIYLIDDEDMKVEDIVKGYCWFKGKSMSYRIIPNP